MFVIAKNLKQSKCLSTGEWIHLGVFVKENSFQELKWVNYNYKHKDVYNNIEQKKKASHKKTHTIFSLIKS